MAYVCGRIEKSPVCRLPPETDAWGQEKTEETAGNRAVPPNSGIYAAGKCEA